LGGSLYTQITKFDKVVDGLKQKTQLELPHYGIARFRPKVAAALEIDRLTLSATGILRWLGTTEPTARIQDDKTYVRVDRKGWIGYGEFSAAFQVNDAVAVDVTYKVGAVPPQFIRVNIVQSGIVYHF
jgi:hypothetical protein